MSPSLSMGLSWHCLPPEDLSSQCSAGLMIHVPLWDRWGTFQRKGWMDACSSREWHCLLSWRNSKHLDVSSFIFIEISPLSEIHSKVQTRKYLNYLAIFIANGSFLGKKWWSAFDGHSFSFSPSLILKFIDCWHPAF